MMMSEESKLANRGEHRTGEGRGLGGDGASDRVLRFFIVCDLPVPLVLA